MPFLSMTKPDIIFEHSWEVCNKVGGIYTVVMSKIERMQEHFNSYIALGPYIESKAASDFEEQVAPKDFKEAIEVAAKSGIRIYYGKWKVKGSPQTILVDFREFASQKDLIKKNMWDWYQIDSLNAGWDFEEPIIWSYATGIFLEAFAKSHSEKKISLQAHEWMSGASLLYLKKHKAPIGTVFTTHATMLGRAIAGSNQDLYGRLESIDPKAEAYKLKVQDKYLTELACAKNAEVFSTVSEITAIEAEKFFGRKPEVLVLNGLDIHKFPTIEETSIRHVTVRDKIREFLTYYFFPYYSIDLSHNLIFFILGRYEFRNKGIDIFIKALGRLNEELKAQGSERTISVFFWIPAAQSGLKTEILENKNYYHHIKDEVDRSSGEIKERIVSSVLANSEISCPEIFPNGFKDQLKADMKNFKRKGNPPLSTHYMDEDHDVMINEIKKNGMLNREEDKVKVIVYPVYLDGHDEMTNLNYYDAIAGCHLGVFPSYYEPWGYTPLEAGALGVASVTTDLAGFGRFIAEKNKENQGIFILDRVDKSEEEIVDSFTKILSKYANFSHEERVENKAIAKKLSALADWSVLIENYVKAHSMAVEKIKN